MKKIIICILVFSFIFISNAYGSVINISKSNDINEITKKLTNAQLLALAIYGEARGESEYGKIAVGTVVLERAEKIKSKYAIRQVLLKRKAFSCFNKNNRNFPIVKRIALNWKMMYKKNYALKSCYLISSSLLDGSLPKNKILCKNNTTHYQVIGNNSKWSRSMILVAVIDNHEFYTEKEKKTFI